MPTYEYACRTCGDKFDVFQSITSDPLTVCEKCGGEIKRVIGLGAGIIFKGSGFYVNDYKKDSSSIKKDKPCETTTTESKPSCCTGSCGCSNS